MYAQCTLLANLIFLHARTAFWLHCNFQDPTDFLREIRFKQDRCYLQQSCADAVNRVAEKSLEMRCQLHGGNFLHRCRSSCFALSFGLFSAQLRRAFEKPQPALKKKQLCTFRCKWRRSLSFCFLSSVESSQSDYENGVRGFVVQSLWLFADLNEEVRIFDAKQNTEFLPHVKRAQKLAAGVRKEEEKLRVALSEW